MLLIQHMCCYFGNIELDRDDAGFARLDPDEKVDWWDTLGNEIEVSPEERANDWACDLLLPDRMLSDDIQEKPVTFDTVRELASRYRTDVAPAAIRLVASANGDAMLVRSRPGEASKCLQSNGVSIDFWLREEPGPGTVAHDLLRGSREVPGPREVLLDGWFKPEPAWWFTVQEDSIAMPGGEVFSILWWEEDGYEALLKFKDDLAAEPGEEAVRRLVEGVVKEFGYRAVETPGGVTVLLEKEPSDERIVINDAARMDAASIRRLVDEIARQRDVHRDVVLDSMLDWESVRMPYRW